MILAAVLCVAIAIVVFATMGPVADAARAAYTAPPPKPDQIAAGVQVFFTIVAVVFLLVAVGEVVLGLLDLRGSNVARIISWVFNGLVVLCFGCFGALSLGRGNPTVTTGTRNPDGVDTATFNKAVEDAFPSWSGPAFGTLIALAVIAALISIILLALPASNAFFRRGRGGPDTGMTELAYPTVPGYPPVPVAPPPAPATPPAPPAAEPPAAEPPTTIPPPAEPEGAEPPAPQPPGEPERPKPPAEGQPPA